MKEVKLDRTHFHESLAAEYFDKKKLEAQTGQPFDKFSDVILKELLDNALDACESMGIDPVIHIGFSTTEDRMRLCVRDNGNGISEELLKNILNFEKRTSDKVAYESPSRGAQGNALKTIIGIPYALGGGKIIIESHGLHNEIIATANPAGLIDINLKTTEILDRAGTTIYVDFPVCTIDFFWWGQAFAIFNPHALVKITQFDDFEFALNLDDENLESGVFVKNDEIERKVTMVTSDYENSENVVFYQKIADCSKIKPNAPTSSHWYNSHALVKLVFLQGDQHDITIRDFVRQFDGLSSTSKAKQITSQITGKMLSDIYRDPVEIEKLRLAMQALSKPMLPKTLGAIGEENLSARFNVKGRHWYKQVSGMIDNKPYVFEILITETEKQAYYFGVNHSVTFGDYLREASIKAVDKGKAKIWGRGIKGALDKILEGQHTVVAHLIEIGLPFLDHGKSNLSLPYHMVENISGAVWKAVKVLHKNQLQRQKNAERYYRYNESINKELKDVKVTLKAAVFTVMEAAIKAATDNKSGPASVRQVFYQVRPLIQPHTTEILTWTYFQKLIHRYWREYEHNPLVYNDPRGVLYTPHSGREVHLGTFSVESFEFPDYEYNKILYIEKKGLWPAIKDANLHKRYDMVVIAGEGYATEAIRVLLEKAQVGKNYAIFVLHDADHAGYNIARTLQSATERMPNHNIRVHDLGLTVQDSIDMGLEPETYPCQIDLPKGLLLNAIEQEYFEGEWQETSWLCKRVELNAMNRGQLIAYIKNGIDRISEEFGLEKKVIAPGQVLLEKAQEKIKSALEEKFEELLSEQLKLDNAKAELFEAFSDEFDEEELTDDVVDYLIENQFKTWGDSIQDVVDEKMDDIDADVENKIIELVMVAIKAA